jgi:hemoglobin
MIGYFFFGKDHESLLRQQLAFTSSMLGGPRGYAGRSLPQVHEPLAIRPAHFARRQKILRETMDEFGLDADLAAAWIAHEDKLRAFIMPSMETCRD